MKKEIKILNDKIEKINNDLFEIKRSLANLKNKPKFEIGESVEFNGMTFKIIDIYQGFMNQIHSNNYTLEISYVDESELKKIDLD